ncbi:Lrp/AsnC family transcriptional regulator [Rhodococcus opacus]|uniref:Lrp/AsnC family transcriptional regulator n=1 Tax=Rhodococcus opacus TaxID=37919 RepID=UPI001C45AF6B|nr:Lrp/AsnC ligand binding domain-containing protein [Rhodococcus opacus]MBV6756440.1 Lrp/AsnC ligand binding domain-containing protein [Rhodococcus opacus]
MHSDLTEDDMALIHALQIWPRGSWRALAPILEASPMTLANRWNRLRDAGLAWVTALAVPGLLSGYSSVALVEVDCVRDSFDDVVARLEQTRQVIAIEHAARGRDLLLTVDGGSFDGLAAFLVDVLNRIPGIASTRSHLGVRVHLEGSRWRLDALDPGQREAVTALRQAARPDLGLSHPRPRPTPLLAAVEKELFYDGRASAADIATRLDRPSSTARRALATLLGSGDLAVRCEVAQWHTRWPISVTWWCRLPGEKLDDIVGQLRRDGNIRMCVSLTGPSNFAVQAWVADMADLMATQTRLEHILRPGEITDSSVTLRTRKRNGWLLQPDGRARGDRIPLM